MLQWLKCLFWHHKYFVLEKLSISSKKIGCKSCKNIFAINDDVKVVLRWDCDLEEFYQLQKNFKFPGDQQCNEK